MTIEQILAHCDHTELKPTATFADIKQLIDDAIQYKTASVCIPPCYVREAAAYAAGRMKICTVIGFPNGYNSSSAKTFETLSAVNEGADEIDMVINIGQLKAGNIEYVEKEIASVKNVSAGRLLKVIIETCLLTEEEIVTMCKVVTRAGADYIKTSTGFSKAGATPNDVSLMVANVGEGVKVKAAGGIRTLEAAEEYLRLGADRLGASAIVGLAKAQNN